MSFEDWENPEDTEIIIKRLQENQQNLQLYKIAQKLLENRGKKISLQIKKEKIKYDGGFRKMIWSPLPVEQVSYQNLWEVWVKTWEELQPWEIWTYITFEDTKSGQIKLSVHQLERPNWFMPDWIWCHIELNADEFLDIMKEKSDENVSDTTEWNQATKTGENENNEKKWWFMSRLKNKFKKVDLNCFDKIG